MDHRCKGKRPAEHTLPESTKRALVEYSSSEEEMSQQGVSGKTPAQAWRTTAEPPSSEEDTDTESEEEEMSVAAATHPFRAWRATVSSDEESSDDELWHNEREEGEESDEQTVPLPPHTGANEEELVEATAPLSLETLKKALPWALYQGMPEEQFSAATQQMGGNPLFEFDFAPISRRQWLKKVEKTVYSTRLRQRRAPEDTDDVGVAIVNAMEEATRQHLDKIGARDEDRVFLAMTPNGFEHTYQTTEFTVHEFREGSTRLETLMWKLANKLNSNEAFNPDDGFQLDLTLVRPMGTGSGNDKKLNPRRMGYQMSREVKHSIVEIKNKDDLCCARAIVTMKARADWKVMERKVQEEEGREVSVLLDKLRTEEKEAFKDYETLRRTPKTNKKTLQLQRTLAKQLHLVAGVPEGPCGPDEINTFQTYLSAQDPPFQLKVFCDQVRKPLFIGPIKTDEDHVLVLLKSGNHYDGIASLKGFLNRSYYCHQCDRGFNTDDPDNHSCQGQICRACGGKPCPDRFKKKDTLCVDCNGLFHGPSCLQHHKTGGRCDKYHTCTTCCARYNTDKDHTCGEAKCPSCGELEDLREHRCYIQPVEEEEDGLEPPLFVYADIEAMTLPDRKFQPNLLCYETSEGKKDALWGEMCCLRFIEKLEKMAWIPVGKKKMKERPVIILFHNLKGFDGVFMLNALYKDGRSVTDQFCMGAKVLSITSGPLTFKDSLCFPPFSLSAFPATFGIENEELKKGYFPHAFNTLDHQDYVGSIPDKTYYDPEGMKPKDKKTFEEWYVEQQGLFDFKKELLGYCESDVELLKAGCEAFVRQFSQEAHFNPFEKCTTIASACNLYWRRSIKEDTDAAKIAVRPLRGWHGATVNQSKAALQWLAYEESRLPLGGDGDQIKHARNGGEKKLRTSKGKEFVDGWYKKGNTVYEFLGCLWHGCLTCYPHKRNVKHSIMPDRSPNEARRATQEKTERLREQGYTVKEMWECQWKRLVEEDASVKSYVERLERVDPLVPRDAFFGGRTGAVSLYHKVGSGEEIHYMDVTSLYPWGTRKFSPMSP